MSLPTGTVTFLFTDIEGSTRLWEQHQEQMRSALACHDAILREAIEHHNGYVFKTVGDAFCAAFPTASDALASALSAQQTLIAEPWPAETPLRVRMALHTGQSQERDNDYFGPPINRVARLLSIGHGEQVLLSQAAYDLVHERLPEGCTLRDMSAHRLKDLLTPEHVFQLLHPALPSDFPPLRSLQAFANNLPVQWTSFIGREKEIEEVKNLLAGTHLLTLTGSGGCGKTRLALQVAADLVEDYSDGVWLAELAALSEPKLVVQAVATALGLRDEPGRTLLRTVTDYLLSKSTLLVLDNCEHLLPACAELTETLLNHCPHLRILTTSREGLRIGGEQVYRVPSLPAPDLASLPTEENERAALVSESDAVRLFVERTRLQRPEFVLTSQNASGVASVCSRLDGIPLAIELAAARVRVLSVEEIDAGLEDRFELLTGGSRTALPRQQTLRAALDWSYDLLTEQERLLLSRLSVFAGGWTLKAARKVCGDRSLPVGSVLDVLSGLVDKSLVAAETQGGSSRYRLLETVRQYGRERLAQTGDESAIRGRHREYYLELAEEIEPRLTGPEQAEWLLRLEAEHDNLRVALGWCQAEQDGAEAGLRLAGALWLFWDVRGYLGMGREYLGEALAREGALGRAALRAKALNAAGGLAFEQGDYSSARVLFEESLSLCRELGDKPGIASTLGNLGIVASDQGDYRSARVLFEESLSLCRELGDKPGTARSLNNVGIVAFEQGDYRSARVLFEESLLIKRELGNKRGIASTLGNLGNVAYCQGDYSSARALMEESLSIQRELGDKQGIAWSLNRLGNVTSNQGDNIVARALYEESLSIDRELGNKNGITLSLLNLGEVASYQGDYEAAKSLFEESLSLCRELGDKRGTARSLNNVGELACEQGDYEAARALMEESLSLRRELGDKWGIAYSLEAFASLAVAEGQPERAARLWGAAEALREAIHAPLPPNEREQYARDLAAVRATLGEEAFSAAWAAGRAMTIEQAMEYALEKTDTREAGRRKDRPPP